MMMKSAIALLAGTMMISAIAAQEPSVPPLEVSTLFTAQDVARRLNTDEGLDKAVAWCKKYAVDKVFVESFRGDLLVSKDLLVKARDRFRNEGLIVSGCITPTSFGKQSTGWNLIACYTAPESRARMNEVFSFTAGLFDEIMIDDFFFTDCTCEACDNARGDRSWSEYRLDLMRDVSRKDVLGAARGVNPDVEIIIKYPQWYDLFHERGYDVDRQTKIFDRIWVGTETRDPDSEQWGRKAQYEGYFIMRWLGVIGGDKCGGGWFDPYGTSPATYCEQARQTVLAGARDMLYFCYGALQAEEHKHKPDALRPELDTLKQISQWVRTRKPRGIIAVKPPNSPPVKSEEYIFDFIGMLGIPLVPEPALDVEGTKALFISSHLRSEPDWQAKLRKLAEREVPILASPDMKKDATQADYIAWDKDPREIMDMPESALNELRNRLLKPFGITFNAPGKVALYLMDQDFYAIENFRDETVTVELKGVEGTLKEQAVLPPGAKIEAENQGNAWTITIPPRTLVVGITE
jgi:hypothetical protein